MKVTINGIIAATKSYDDEKPLAFYFLHSDTYLPYGMVTVCAHTLEVEIPDDFSLEAARKAALTKEKEQIVAEFSRRIKDVDARLESA